MNGTTSACSPRVALQSSEACDGFKHAGGGNRLGEPNRLRGTLSICWLLPVRRWPRVGHLSYRATSKEPPLSFNRGPDALDSSLSARTGSPGRPIPSSHRDSRRSSRPCARATARRLPHLARRSTGRMQLSVRASASDPVDRVLGRHGGSLPTPGIDDLSDSSARRGCLASPAQPCSRGSLWHAEARPRFEAAGRPCLG